MTQNHGKQDERPTGAQLFHLRAQLAGQQVIKWGIRQVHKINHLKLQALPATPNPNARAGTKLGSFTGAAEQPPTIYLCHLCVICVSFVQFSGGGVPVILLVIF